MAQAPKVSVKMAKRRVSNAQTPRTIQRMFKCPIWSAMLLESSKTPLCACKNIHGERQVPIPAAYEWATHVRPELDYTFSVEIVQKLQEHQCE